MRDPHVDTLPPLAPAERERIDHAVRAIIRRVGQHDADPSVARPKITMADLPTL